MMTELLALDGGQSGMRTYLRGRDGSGLGPEFAGIRSDQPVLPQLRDIVLATLDGDRADVVALGVSGLGLKDTAADLKSLLGGAAGTVLLAHDATTSYLGALGAREGAVVASGTGAVTLAVGPHRVWSVDGWGHLLGDKGSGFWIGSRALACVLEAQDGRGEPTTLTEHAVAEFGELSQLYLQIQADPGRVSRIASWARLVSELAPTDAVCASISRDAGQELARSVSTALARVGAQPVASTVGNVFLNSMVTEAFGTHLRELVEDVQVVPAAGTGLDGAVLLPGVSPGSALDALVDRAD